MKWITREHPRVDRVACPWLIEKFVDKDAEFIYVPTDEVMAEARARNATPYDVKDVELGHRGPECSFDAFIRKYGLGKDPAMAYMAKVIRGADTADKTITPESVGIEALLEGVRLVHTPRRSEAARGLAADPRCPLCVLPDEGGGDLSSRVHRLREFLGIDVFAIGKFL